MSHRRSLLLCALLLGAATPGLQAAAPITAQAAYDAKDWKTCAALYGALADRQTPQPGAQISAASCLARAGQRDAALARLVRSNYRDRPSIDVIAQDPDLASLHGDPRWAQWLDAERKAQTQRGYDPALVQQLAERSARDQAIREQVIAQPKDVALNQQAIEIDRDNTA